MKWQHLQQQKQMQQEGDFGPNGEFLGGVAPGGVIDGALGFLEAIRAQAQQLGWPSLGNIPGGQTTAGGFYNGLAQLMGTTPDVVERALNNAQGIQDLDPRLLQGGGLNTTMGQNGQSSRSMNQEDLDQNNAVTYIPFQFRMRHVRVGSGRHDAMLGRRTMFTFANKRSCAAFCRAWNQMFSHVGSADPFIPGDCVQIFSDVLIGGSGQFGIDNEFSPPFKGRM